MSSVAIIPARGGSKRIPNKNIRAFAGKPIIAHSIETATASGLFDDVIVSTDCEAVAEVARGCGASVPFMRPSRLADDFTCVDDVVLHALDFLDAQHRLPRYACCIYATAPLLKPCYVEEGYRIIRARDVTSAIAVTTFGFPIFRALRRTDDGFLRMWWPEHRTTRSQDLPAAYHDAGQFFWVNVGRYRTVRRCYADDAVAVTIPRNLVQDIDTMEDWVCAEGVYRALAEAP